MGRIIHFEVTSDDARAAVEFYRQAFGWEADESPFLPDYFLTDTGGGSGINGAVMSSRYREQSVILWIEVDNLDEKIAAVEKAGGTLAGEINEIPGQGRVCYVQDHQGTLFGFREATFR